MNALPVPSPEEPSFTPRKRAGLVPVLALLYASTCGGPYGTEDFVARIGPGAFLLLLFVTPWLYGIPLAFATAELSSRRSVEGGYYRWASRYLGEFWGFQAGAWSILSTVLDTALYPLLFARGIRHFVPGMTDNAQWAVAALFIAVLTYVNYRGITVAGATATALNIFLIAPLLWIVAASLFHLRFNPFVPVFAPGKSPAAEFGTCLALAMWFYSGYDELSTAADEIENPRRMIPLCLAIITPVVILSYALPTMAGLSAVGGWESWSSGEFASIGQALGGSTLRDWTFLAAVASQTVIFLAYMLWCSRVAWAMADDRWLPHSLSALHPRYGTPHRLLILSGVCNIILARLPIEDILVADTWLAGAYTLLIHASLLASRRTESPLPGAFRVPGGRIGLLLNAFLPALTWVVLLALTFRENPIARFGPLLAGPVLYLGMRWLRGKPSAPAESESL